MSEIYLIPRYRGLCYTKAENSCCKNIMRQTERMDDSENRYSSFDRVEKLENLMKKGYFSFGFFLIESLSSAL